MSLNTKAISALHTWVSAPTNANDLFVALEAMTISDLNYVALSEDVSVARIAWIEFARRRGLVDFTIKLVEVEGGLEVNCSSAAIPIANQILLASA